MFVTGRDDDLDWGALGAAVEELRARHGWTKAHLARRAGCSTKTIDRLEKGEPKQLETMNRIADALQVDPDRLLAVGRGDVELPPTLHEVIAEMGARLGDLSDRLADVERALDALQLE